MAQKKLASRHQMAEIGVMLAKGEIDRDLAQAIIRKRVEIIKKPREFITVPNLSAAELIAQAKKLGLKYLDKDLAAWDFIRDERGKTYEVLVWKPGRQVAPATEVRPYFKGMGGFTGNTAAFIAWVTKHDPEGYHASIPEDDRLVANGDRLYAPFFYHDNARELFLFGGVRGEWGGGWAYVAFREAKD